MGYSRRIGAPADQTSKDQDPGGALASQTELLWTGGLALLLLVFFLGLFVARGFRFPVGPDGPVYLWWTRLAQVEGLSAVERPGVPAVVLALSGTLHLPIAAVAAALQCGLGVTLGLSAAMLLRARDANDRATWLLGGTLAGLFAVHLVSGYLANLALAATFLAAAVVLALGTRRGALAAGALLAAGGFAHPQFFLVALAILGLAAAFAARGPRARSSEAARTGEDSEAAHGGISREAVRTGQALLAAVGVAGAGFLALRLRGPGVLNVETSRDAFLRRVGMLDTLRGLYRYRFVHRAARYVQWISVPLALWGAPKVRGPVGRLLAAWAVVTAAGVAFGLATGLLPPDRFVTFGYVVPLLAAVGAMRLWRSLHPRRAVATLVVAALVTLMALGSFFAWRREKPFLTQAQVGAVTDASGWIGATPPGTPLFFVVETGDDTITFFATQAENTIRAAVPPERIPDVHILVLPGEAPPGSERAILSRSTLDDYLIAASGASPVTMELRPFAAPIYGVNAPGLPAPLVELAPGLAAAGLPDGPAPAASDPLEPTSPAQISLAAFEVLAVLGLAGYGWARAAGLHAAAAAALAPAFGLGALTLAALALERVGVPLGGSAGPTAVSLAAGAGGFCARYLLERRPAR